MKHQIVNTLVLSAPPPPPPNGGEYPPPPPPPLKCNPVEFPLKNVLSSFEEQDKLWKNWRQRWSLYLLLCLCIYSGVQTRHNQAWTLELNFTLKIKVNQRTIGCFVPFVWIIGRTSRQPNYPNQLVPKRGSERSLRFGPQSHMVSLSGNLPIVQARDTLSRRSYQPIVLAKPLMAPLISCS